MEYTKDFDTWNITKKVINSRVAYKPIRPGEIRWANLGVNVGSEIDGKGAGFTRPVLIIHTIGKNMSLIIPLTSKVKTGAGYIKIVVKGIQVSACIMQIKTISNNRLLSRVQKISGTLLLALKDEIKNFYKL